MQLSVSTLAMACDLSRDFANRVMTDMFRLLIEVCRTTKQEAKLDFKFGVLRLHKNGELTLEDKDANDDDTKTEHGYGQSIRDDISLIDTASAILSNNRGRAISVRSDCLENLSVRTPMTKITTRSFGNKSTISSSRSQCKDKQAKSVFSWNSY